MIFGENAEVFMRLIKTDEVVKVSRLLTDIFADYEAYRLFFPEEKKMANGMEMFFRYEIYASQPYTRVDEDFLAVAAVKRPGDSDRNPKTLFLNPFFACSFLSATGIKAVRLAGEYIAFAEKIAEKYYNPAVDCYIKNIGVAREARGQGRLRRMIDELCGEFPVYLETHDENNVAIYEHLGFRVCEKADFHGYTHYAMRRD